MAIHLSDLDGFGVDPYSELPFLRNLNFKFLYFSENRKKKKNYMQKKKKLYAKKKKMQNHLSNPLFSLDDYIFHPHHLLTEQYTHASFPKDLGIFFSFFPKMSQ